MPFCNIFKWNLFKHINYPNTSLYKYEELIWLCKSFLNSNIQKVHEIVPIRPLATLEYDSLRPADSGERLRLLLGRESRRPNVHCNYNVCHPTWSSKDSSTAVEMSYMTVDMWEEGRRRSFKRSWKTSYLASGAKGKLERALLDDPDGPSQLHRVEN